MHGQAEIVPLSQSRDYAALDPEAEVLAVPGADHFDVIDVGHAAWVAEVDWLTGRLGREGPAGTRANSLSRSGLASTARNCSQASLAGPPAPA